MSEPIPATLVAGDKHIPITLTAGQLYDNIRLKILAASHAAKVEEAAREIAYARAEGHLLPVELDRLASLATRRLEQLAADDAQPGQEPPR